MQKFTTAVFTLLLAAAVNQVSGQVVTKHFVHQKVGVFDYSAPSENYQPALLIKEMPKQGSKKIIQYNYPETAPVPLAKPTTTLPGLIKGMSFQANPFSVSTPCDNDFAISDTGFIVSVTNTNIYLRNTNPNQVLPIKTLANFTNPINNKHQEFDPKVIYDPDYKRFILLCLVGNTDSTSKVIVGFSQTENPSQAWNLYTLPGDPINNNLWTDYPMVALTQKDFYLSVNLLYNDSSWQTGFVETIVWQIKKTDGYQGLPLNSDLHSNIKYNGKAIRNLCPAKGGSKLYGPNMYFVSNRNLASQNDTVFLVNITDTTGAPGNTVTAKAMVSNLPYRFPPDALQPIASQSLATNDSRNLGAFFENNKIQYVHNTKNPQNNRSTIYHGVITNLSAATPTVTGYMIDNDSLYFGYPNISYSGNGPNDDMSIITFDHSSTLIKPGVSAVQADGLGNYSTVLRIQNGNQYVNLLQGNLERWGDYSGSQRRYNRPGEVWMSGYLGATYNASYPYAHAAWIAQLTNSTVPVDETALKEQAALKNDVSIYPVPATDRFTVDFHLNKPEYLSFDLLDMSGKVVTVLLRDWVKTSDNTFSFNTKDLPKGVYTLRISGNYLTRISKKIVIN